ncbi:MAG: iron-sulfur cluster repair di-iron protein, partial [Planctomycetes bacterium]|nr:iron-sulfur cluster repair di-iron protein [Planctomycetota bacterium]
MRTNEEKELTVGEMVVEDPSRARVFEHFRIDYCCGGKISLAEACATRGTDLDAVLKALNKSQANTSPKSEKDWSQESMTSLVDHIVATHHAYLREEFPRLTKMTERVVQVHGERHLELPEVRDVFAALRNELEQHMQKEEQILFPMIKQLDSGVAGAAGHCGTIANPIRMMEDEHDNAGDALGALRKLTGGFAVPVDACNTYRVMLDSLAKLEADLHQHIHKENNILFPKALAAESHA